VLDRVREQPGGCPDDARDIARGVDGRVPASASQPIEAAVAVAADLLELREEAGVPLAAVEERELVAAGGGALDEVAAEEGRAAEDQELHSPQAYVPRAPRS